MKILIIEDEIHTANRLKSILQEYNSDIEIVAILTSVQASLEWFRIHKSPDLVFQDIELSDGQCFEIYDAISIKTPIIFTTAFSEYALKAFKLNSIDYLLKPYDGTDIKRVMDKLLNYRYLFTLPQGEVLKSLVYSEKPLIRKRFLVRIGDTYHSLMTSDIAYFVSEEGLSFAILTNGKRYPIDQSLNDLCETLDNEKFIRVNRTCVVSHRSIIKVTSWFNSRLKLLLTPATNTDIIVSRERVKDFKAWMGG